MCDCLYWSPVTHSDVLYYIVCDCLYWSLLTHPLLLSCSRRCLLRLLPDLYGWAPEVATRCSHDPWNSYIKQHSARPLWLLSATWPNCPFSFNPLKNVSNSFITCWPVCWAVLSLPFKSYASTSQAHVTHLGESSGQCSVSLMCWWLGELSISLTIKAGHCGWSDIKVYVDGCSLAILLDATCVCEMYAALFVNRNQPENGVVPICVFIMFIMCAKSTWISLRKQELICTRHHLCIQFDGFIVFVVVVAGAILNKPSLW